MLLQVFSNSLQVIFFSFHIQPPCYLNIRGAFLGVTCGLVTFGHFCRFIRRPSTIVNHIQPQGHGLDNLLLGYVDTILGSTIYIILLSRDTNCNQVSPETIS